MLEVVRLTCEVAGTGVVPDVRGTGTPPGEIPRQWVDSTKLRTASGWAPAGDLEEGCGAPWSGTASTSHARVEQAVATLAPMPARVILMANDSPGVQVAEYLAGRDERIVRLYLHDPDRRRRGEEIVAAAGADEVFAASALRDPDHVAALHAPAADFIVTVFWAHLLPAEVLAAASRGTVNFHPSLLPRNRGWFPHVHNIVDGSPAGVTLHAMDIGADTGAVWAQREVPQEPSDTALTLYLRLQSAIVGLFRETWPGIVDGTLTPQPQSAGGASFNSRSDVDVLDRLDLDAPTTGRRFLDVLRARSFGDRGFAFFEADGRRVYVNVRLGPKPRLRVLRIDGRHATASSACHRAVSGGVSNGSGIAYG